MYKIVGKFYGEDVAREATDANYAIGVFMALVQRGMQYTDAYDANDAIDEAIDVSRDVYTDYLPHYHELNSDMWLELRKE